MTRLISGVVLAAAALAAILFLPTSGLRLLACGVAALAALEYLHIVSGERFDPVWVLVAIACWFLASPGSAITGLAIVAAAAVALEVLFRNASIGSAGARYFAVWYIGLPLGLLVAIHTLAGREAVLVLIATIVISDSAQYYSGRAFGRHPLAPAISPKKTIEGAVGGLVIGTIFFALAAKAVLPFARTATVTAVGAGIVVAGIAGDLFESRLKRAANLKDSSTLIPGHGGILDRVDALLFAIPVFYLFIHEVM